MTDILKPRDAKEVEDAVRWALGNDKALEVVGQGSKRAIGRPSQTDLTLDLSELSGITLYEPAELVLSAKAGTPLHDIEVLLDKHNQELAFEPMDYGPLLGGPAGRGTIGGVIAANLSGPRRIKAGAARDHFLGVTAVIQLIVALQSGSVGLLADTIHNFSDALTAIPLWLAFLVARRPANRRYTYGYGRAEDLAGVAIVLIILASAVLAFWESYRKLIEPTPLPYVGWSSNTLSRSASTSMILRIS